MGDQTTAIHRVFSVEHNGALRDKQPPHCAPWPLGVALRWLFGSAALSIAVTIGCIAGVEYLASLYSMHASHRELVFAVTLSSYALHNALVVAFIVYKLHRTRRPLEDLWGAVALRPSHIALGVAAGAVLMGMQAALHEFTAGETASSSAYDLRLDGRLVLILELLINAVLIGSAEEMLFRGVVFRALLNTLSDGWAIVLSAGLFALFHFDYAASLSAALYITAFGAVAAYLFLHTRSLNTCIALHITCNAIERLVHYAPHMQLFQ